MSIPPIREKSPEAPTTAIDFGAMSALILLSVFTIHVSVFIHFNPRQIQSAASTLAVSQLRIKRIPVAARIAFGKKVLFLISSMEFIFK